MWILLLRGHPEEHCSPGVGLPIAGPLSSHISPAPLDVVWEDMTGLSRARSDHASSLVQLIGHDVLAMSLAQDVRHSHRVLLFAVVSVVGHFTNILRENLSVKFLSSRAKNCSFP
ncbi:unnamed protein product [Pleuronectes platessa]|uniref:Uncharacterized protein n=1 Tax=Pleuronectes platessa TaxID=8262 RepID=A0A9N7VB13_PLEPL|nr:unnamed protein product [Pleuronectes platessa]